MKKKHRKAPTKLINKSNLKKGLKKANKHARNIKPILKILKYFYYIAPNKYVSNLVRPTLIKQGKTLSSIKKYKI